MEKDSEPISNLSASVDISDELLNAAIDTSETFEKDVLTEAVPETSNNTIFLNEQRFELATEYAEAVENNETNHCLEVDGDHKPSEPMEKVESNGIKVNSNIYPQLQIDVKPIEEPVFTPSIKAYTEQQLSSLYRNEELQLLKQFTDQFIEAELRGATAKQHLLYDLLTNYLKSRSKIIGINLEIEQLRKEYGEKHSLLWNLESSVISGRGECQDGTTVMATHTYTRATFQRNLYQNIVKTLTSICTLANESHTLYSYSAEVIKLQVCV